MAKALGGADISFFIGLAVAPVLYYIFSRSIDVAAGRAGSRRRDRRTGASSGAACQR